jgi:Flp pilus assembly protein TadD
MDMPFAVLVRQSNELLAGNLRNLQQPAQTGPGLEDAAFERLYGFGFRLLAADQFEQALAVFAFLFAQRPTEPRVLSGFGHSLLGLGDLGQAAMMHSLAYAAEPNNPAHVLAMAEDLIAMEAPMAADLLQAAEALAADPQHAAIAARARALRELLSGGS